MLQCFNWTIGERHQRMLRGRHDHTSFNVWHSVDQWIKGVDRNCPFVWLSIQIVDVSVCLSHCRYIQVIVRHSTFTAVVLLHYKVEARWGWVVGIIDSVQNATKSMWALFQCSKQHGWQVLLRAQGGRQNIAFIDRHIHEMCVDACSCRPLCQYSTFVAESTTEYLRSRGSTL